MGEIMIGDDDFFMQNADYHYGANDAEKMYGRNYDDSDVGGYYPRSYAGNGSINQNAGSENDNSGKYCLAGILIVLAIIVIATVIVPAVTNSMASSVIVDDLKITSTYNQKSYGTHAINVIFYSKNGKVLYNDSNYVGTCYLGDVPYQVHLDEKADYAIFEVYRTHLDYGKCIYSERVDVDNVNVKKEFIDYDALYN